MLQPLILQFGLLTAKNWLKVEKKELASSCTYGTTVFVVSNHVSVVDKVDDPRILRI